MTYITKPNCHCCLIRSRTQKQQCYTVHKPWKGTNISTRRGKPLFILYITLMIRKRTWSQSSTVRVLNFFLLKSWSLPNNSNRKSPCIIHICEREDHWELQSIKQKHIYINNKSCIPNSGPSVMALQVSKKSRGIWQVGIKRKQFVTFFLIKRYQ